MSGFFNGFFTGLFFWIAALGFTYICALTSIEKHKPRLLCRCGVPIKDCENSRLFHAELDDMEAQHREYAS